jgi:hypothetical protein
VAVMEILDKLAKQARIDQNSIEYFEIDDDNKSLYVEYYVGPNQVVVFWKENLQKIKLGNKVYYFEKDFTKNLSDGKFYLFDIYKHSKRDILIPSLLQDGINFSGYKVRATFIDVPRRRIMMNIEEESEK